MGTYVNGVVQFLSVFTYRIDRGMYNRVYERLLHAPTVSPRLGVYADCVLRVTESTNVLIVRPDPLAFLYTILSMRDILESSVTFLAHPCPIALSLYNSIIFDILWSNVTEV